GTGLESSCCLGFSKAMLSYGLTEPRSSGVLYTPSPRNRSAFILTSKGCRARPGISGLRKHFWPACSSPGTTSDKGSTQRKTFNATRTLPSGHHLALQLLQIGEDGVAAVAVLEGLEELDLPVAVAHVRTGLEETEAAGEVAGDPEVRGLGLHQGDESAEVVRRILGA